MYIGDSYKVPMSGGWNANPNFDYVANEAMIDPKNINHHRGGREPRGGAETVYATPVSASTILGGYQFTLDSGTAFNVVGRADGTIDHSNTTVLKTGLGANKYFHFEKFYNKLYICNGYNMPMTWDGAAATALSFLTAAQSLACTPALAGAGAGTLSNGVYTYKITFVATTPEYNVNHASVSVTVVDYTTDGQIALTGIPVGPTGTTARKIYRTVANGSTYKYVATLADNTTTTYTDNISDATILAAATIIAPNIASAPSDWSGTSFPSVMISHGTRAQKRLWTFLGNYLYASASGTDDFSDTEVTTIKVLCTALTGLIEFGGRLLAFSKDKTFIVDDVSLDIAEWGYQSAVWEGGAAHQRLIIKTPTDVMVMSETAEMFSISASQQYGDYQVASITRPAYLHKWVETTLDLTKIDQFHGVYDQELRCIKIFVVSTGKTYPDIAMVFFVDLGPQMGWTKHEFMVNVHSSWVVRVSVSDWKIYTGGTTGKIYALESTTLRDDGTIYRTEWSTPPMIFDNPRSKKRYDRMWLVIKPVALETMSVDILIDDRNLSGNYIVVDEYGNIIGDENGNTLSSESYNPWEITMTGYSNILQNFSDDIGFVGTRIQALVYNTLGENFFISSLIFDVLELSGA